MAAPIISDAVTTNEMWTIGKAYLSFFRPTQAFIVTEPSSSQRLLYRFDIGAQWMGLADQDEDLLKKPAMAIYFSSYTQQTADTENVRV